MCGNKFLFKVKLITIGLFCVSIFCSCGKSENSKVDSNDFKIDAVENHVEKENDKKYTEHESKENNENETNESKAGLPKPLKIPLNTESEDIHVYEKDLVELLSNWVLCRTDGQNLFLLTTLGFYMMPVGMDELYPVDVETPEDMNVVEFAFDVYGRMHLFIAKYDYANEDYEYFIWQLDENYRLNKVIELSSYVESNRMPSWFLILEDGTYYIQWAREQGGIIVSSEGIFKHKFTRESLGIGQTRQAAIGKNGYIYIVHGNGDEKREIARLDVDNCTIENENPVLYFPGEQIFYSMSGGTDTNLLLFSPYDGIWACDPENGILENRVSLTDINLGLDKEVDLWGIKIFLPDGRLLLMGKSAKNDMDTSKGYCFRYIPAGK